MYLEWRHAYGELETPAVWPVPACLFEAAIRQKHPGPGRVQLYMVWSGTKDTGLRESLATINRQKHRSRGVKGIRSQHWSGIDTIQFRMHIRRPHSPILILKASFDMLIFNLFGSSPAAAEPPVSAAEEGSNSHAGAGRTSTLGDRPSSRSSDARHLKQLHSPDVTTRMTAMMTHVSSTPSAVGACPRSPETAPRTSGTGTRSGSPAAAATIKHQSSQSSTTRVHMPELSARGTAKPPRMVSLPSAGSPSSIAKQAQLQEDTPSSQHQSLSLPDAERRATTRRLVQSLESRSAVGLSSPPTLEIRHTRESAAASMFAEMRGASKSPWPSRCGGLAPACGPVLPTSLLESSPGDAKERRHLDRLNHVRRMDRSLDGVTHREFFGGADARLATARTLLPWYNRSYMPRETLVAADGTPVVHVPRLSQAFTQALSDIDQAKTAVHAQASKPVEPSVVSGVILDAATLAQLAQMQSREDVLAAGLVAHEENAKLELQRMHEDFDAKKAEQRGQMLDELERVRASMGLLAARAERAQMPPPAMPMAATAPSALYLYHGGLDDPGAAIAAAHGAEMKGEAAIKAMLVAARADRRDWEYDGMRSGGCMGATLDEQGRRAKGELYPY